jgi:hypothetical protein
MSSILKALKRAENDSPDQGDENRPSFNVRALSSQKLKKRSSLLRPGSVAGLVALTVVLAIVSYSLLFTDNNIPPQAPYVAKKSQVLEIQPDIARNQKQKQNRDDSVDKPSDLPEAPIEILPKSAAQAIDLSKLSNAIVSKPESVDKVPAGSAFSNTTKEKTMVPSDTNPLKKTQIKKDTPKQKIPPLENENLRIQAISWNEEPATRIAVIDNKVLSEGDFVQDYRLVLIEKNSVILHYSGNDYRLEFKY